MGTHAHVLVDLPTWSHHIFTHILSDARLSPLTTLTRGEVMEDTTRRPAAATIVFPYSDKHIVLENMNTYGPGLREVASEKRENRAINEIGYLGILKGGSLRRWHGSKRTLPPCRVAEIYRCAHKPIKSRVAPLPGKKRPLPFQEGRDCSVEVTIRELQLPGDTAPYFIAVTVCENQHCHRCPEGVAQRTPLSIADAGELFMSFLRHSNVAAVMEEVVKAAREKPFSGPATRLRTMTIKDLDDFARRYNLSPPGDISD